MNATLTPNRRAFTRRLTSGKVKVTCHRSGTQPSDDLAVSLGDVSESGLRLLVRETLQKWQEVTIGLTGQDEQRPMQVTGTIVWSEPADGGYLVGVHLAKPLPLSAIQKVT